MHILRTDGKGEHRQDERLKRIRRSLSRYPIESIGLLHDVKGTLKVYWLEEPTERSMVIVELLWEKEIEFRFEHYLITSKKAKRLC